MKITLLYQVSHYIRVKQQRNIKSWDQQNDLVIRGFCYISDLFITRFHCILFFLTDDLVKPIQYFVPFARPCVDIESTAFYSSYCGVHLLFILKRCYHRHWNGWARAPAKCTCREWEYLSATPPPPQFSGLEKLLILLQLLLSNILHYFLSHSLMYNILKHACSAGAYVLFFCIGEYNIKFWWSDICSSDNCSCDDISNNRELEWG